jgi:hypothetical protein
VKAPWSKRTDQLVHAIAPRVRPRLQLELGHWLDDDARFRTFVDRYQDKIRKKLSSDDEDSRLDARAELLLAKKLLSDRRFEVEFEAYGAQRLGPDLSAAFRVNQRIDLEVTRVRSATGVDAAKVANVVAGKLRQLSSGVPNVIVVVGNEFGMTDERLSESMRLVKARRDGRYVRLSAVLTIDEGDALMVWQNPEARHALPSVVLTALLACSG